MLFSHAFKKTDSNEKFDVSLQRKFLSIYVDQHLKWHQHIDYVHTQISFAPTISSEDKMDVTQKKGIPLQRSCTLFSQDATIVLKIAYTQNRNFHESYAFVTTYESESQVISSKMLLRRLSKNLAASIS